MFTLRRALLIPICAIVAGVTAGFTTKALGATPVVATVSTVATKASINGIGSSANAAQITGVTAATAGSVSGDAPAVLASTVGNYNATGYSITTGAGRGDFNAVLNTMGKANASAELPGCGCTPALPLSAAASMTGTLLLSGVQGQGGAMALSSDPLAQGTLQRTTGLINAIPTTTLTATVVDNRSTTSLASGVLTVDGAVLTAPKVQIGTTGSQAQVRLGVKSLLGE
jgi:hypothetical protein